MAKLSCTGLVRIFVTWCLSDASWMSARELGREVFSNFHGWFRRHRSKYLHGIVIKFASFDLPKGLNQSRGVYGRGLGLLVVHWSEISFILRSDWPSASQSRRHSRTR